MALVTSDEDKALAIGKAKQVFRYLEALNQLRNPVQTLVGRQPWSMWFKDLPQHDTICAAGKDVALEDLDGSLLKIGRPRETEAPSPPSALLPWISGQWEDPEAQIVARLTLQRLGSDDEESFQADAQRVASFREWLIHWNKWAVCEKPVRRAMAVYERVYSLYLMLEREGERFELLVGDGLLDWSPADSFRVEHPILLQKVQLLFDPQIPEFTVVDNDDTPELYTALFRAISEVSAAALGRCREDLDTGGWHPLGGGGTTEFFARLVTQLSPRGRLISGEESSGNQRDPRIRRSAVLLLRLRNQGFGLAIESILRDLESCESLPDFLPPVVGVENGRRQADPFSVGDPLSPNGEDESVLLCKPANSEQLEIAKRLERHGAVLVQGPPGTGKTHTIANLLGHLLAQGKSVLVTSHTNKALRVVKDQVVESLRPLCVSALSDNKQDLESSIDLITERLGSLSADVLEKEALALASERAGVLQELRLFRQKLKNARMDEYRSIIVAGKEYAPAEAARWTSAHPTANWIPAPVTLGQPLPMSVPELLELYNSNAGISPEDERELAGLLPDPEQLLAPQDFRRLAADFRRLSQADLDYQARLWSGSAKSQTNVLMDLQERLEQAIEPIGSSELWRMAAIDAGRTGGPSRQAWSDLIEQVEETCSLAAAAQPILYEHGPHFDGHITDEVQRVLQEIIAHLESGGRIGKLKLMFSHAWRDLIEGSRVNDVRPSELEQFKALACLAELSLSRTRLVTRWQRQMVELGAPAVEQSDAAPEQVFQQFIPLIERCLSWYSATWGPIEHQLQEQGLLFAALVQEMPVSLAAHGDLLRLRLAVVEHLPQVLTAQVSRLAWVTVQHDLDNLRAILHCEKQGRGVALQLLRAVDALDAEAYEAAYVRLTTLFRAEDLLRKRQVYLERLRICAPAWAAAIQRREGIHGAAHLPDDPAEAWLWQQLHGELEQRGAISLEELQLRISQLSTSLRQVTADLVEKKAWMAQVRRTTLSQRMALTGWKQMMKRVGKGTGKRAPKLLAEARKLMPECQSAVPVWIMPISRAVENFNPQVNRFDVVIIDEASQADILALTALYLGNEVIVVGDDEQVSPMAIGHRIDEETQLAAEHLKGIPNSALYGGQFSIYDLAQTAFEPVCLREHFRCVAPIIQFSNWLSYNGRIKPLRDTSEARRRPFTVAYRVDGQANGHVNAAEAQAVVSLLTAAMEQPEYADATLGVIAMLGDQQASYINQLLMRRVSPVLWQKHRIQCGSPAEFQGDERDVIFLSMVDSGSGNGPLPLRTEGAGDMFKKRFNVAASRARDQLWVVHSLDIETDLKDGDLRLRLIKYALDPLAADHELADKAKRVESEFERQVLERLLRAGYRVTPQLAVGAYRIDLVVEGNGKRLAVECDGDRWHNQENFLADMSRQAILERLGWTFVRIRGSRFFRDVEGAMAPVFNRLVSMGIQPDGKVVPQEPENGELYDRIVRRAAEFEHPAHDQTESSGAGSPAKNTQLPSIAGRRGSASAVSKLPIRLAPVDSSVDRAAVAPVRDLRPESKNSEVKPSAPIPPAKVMEQELRTAADPIDFPELRKTLEEALAKRPDAVQRSQLTQIKLAELPTEEVEKAVPLPRVGLRVVHSRLGRGVVVGPLDKSGTNKPVVVSFKSGKARLYWALCFRTEELRLEQ